MGKNYFVLMIFGVIILIIIMFLIFLYRGTNTQHNIPEENQVIDHYDSNTTKKKILVKDLPQLNIFNTPANTIFGHIVIATDGTILVDSGDIYQVLKNSLVKFPTSNDRLGITTVINKNEAYGTGNNLNDSGIVYKYTSGKWNKTEMKGAVYGSSDGTLGHLFIDNNHLYVKITKKNKETQTQLVDVLGYDDHIVKLSVGNSDLICARSYHNGLYLVKDGSLKKIKDNITSVSCTFDGTIWALDIDGNVWRTTNYNDWEIVYPKTQFLIIAARDVNTLIGTTKTHKIQSNFL